MFEKAKELFRKIDFIGDRIEPSFNGETKNKSFLGATLTLIIGFVGILGFGFFGSEIITKRNPRSTQSLINVEEATIKLSDLDALILFRSDINILNINPQFMRAVKVYARLSIISTGGNNQLNDRSYIIPIVSCAAKKLSEQSEARIAEKNLDKRAFLCFDFSVLTIPEEEKVIKNYYATDKSISLVTFVEKCNEKLDLGCSAFLEKSVSSFEFSIALPNYSVDVFNYASPVSFTTKTINAELNKDFSSSQLLSLNYTELHSDSGWFLESIESTNFFSHGTIEYAFGPYQESNRLLYYFNMQVPTVKHEIRRSYVKVQEVLANVGGFLKAILLGASLISKGYSDFVLLKRIEAVFESSDLFRKKMQNNKANIDNFVAKNAKDSGVELQVDQGSFKTGVCQTEMTKMDISLLVYFKYLIGNFCRKKSTEDLSKFLCFIDFKHVFTEIIRIKENQAELIEKLNL